MHVGKWPMTRPRLCAMNWQRNWPTSIQVLPKSSPNCLRASSSMTARSTTSTHALPKGADRLLVAELKARGLPLGRELRRDAAHHRSVVPATMAAALELSMATEKIVVHEDAEGFRTTRGQITTARSPTSAI